MLGRTLPWAALLPPGRETARKAARRRAQIINLRQAEDNERVHQRRSGAAAADDVGSASPAASLALGQIPRSPDMPSWEAGMGYLARGARADGDAMDAATATHSSRRGTLEANRTFREVLLGNERESPLQREAREAIRSAPSKDGALEAFFLVARADRNAVSAQLLQEVATALVVHQAKSALGNEAYAVALRDAIGSSEDRWSDVSGEEARVFAVYQCTRWERYAEKGHAFSAAAGRTLEGKDNEAVALVEYQVRRYVSEVAPVPTTVLADLMHLDVSWSAALRLYDLARAQRGWLDPPVDMSDRLMGLMTGYRSNGIGSRPWREALALYQRVVGSGYETTLRTHALALDALWRSADTFHLPSTQRRLDEPDRERVWRGIVQVRANVEAAGLSARIAGDEGCVYYESLIKAVSAAGRTDVAVRLLEEMEAVPEDTSFRLLIPTPESYAFVMAACNAAGNAAHAEAVRALFQRHYTLHDLHSEALLVYLRSLRNVTRTNPTIGTQLVDLIDEPRAAHKGARASGHHLDRPCAVACLQLLTVRAVQLPNQRSKSELAIQLYNSYDGNIWLQEAVARKVELQTVFRCCYLIALEEANDTAAPAAQTRLMRHVEERLRSAFGRDAPELEWLADTEVYGLARTADWRQAMGIFTRQVIQRRADHVKYLPVPLRQVKEMCAAALLRCCYVAAGATGAVNGANEIGRGGSTEDGDSGETFLFLEDEVQEEEQERARQLTERAVALVETQVFPNELAAAQPCALIAELLLLQALCGASGDARRELGVRAMRRMGLGDAASVSPRAVNMAARVLGLTEEYVENVLTEGHPHLRQTALREGEEPSPLRKRRIHPLERVYV